MLLTLLASSTLCANAQRIGLKTNALYWATGTPNLGLELRLSRSFTLNVEGGVNLFDYHSFGLNAATFSPEVRYWHSGRPQTGHFIGALIDFKGMNDCRVKDNMHQGFAMGAGLSYGYSLVLSRRWSIEGTLGAGIIRKDEKKWHYTAEKPQESRQSWKAGLLKAAISITYILK